MQSQQEIFPFHIDQTIPSDVSSASERLAQEPMHEGHGAIYTEPSVVDFILDLVGYTPDRPLHTLRILEPSFGAGDFLLPIIQRLIASWRAHGNESQPIKDLSDALYGVELHLPTFEETSMSVLSYLEDQGIDASTAKALTTRWLKQDDFLLTSIPSKFDFVVGNPPYVRIERIPKVLADEYRRRYQTMYDRADIYIPFFERGLSMLTPEGVLGFICTDRWTKNRYGGPLRRFISERYHLQFYIDLTDKPAFKSDVIAYPSIVILKNGVSKRTRVAYPISVEPLELHAISRSLRAIKSLAANTAVYDIYDVINNDDPWLLDCPLRTALIRRLEATLPSLEETNSRVGIGVATGADKSFIGAISELNVEPDRKLPLVTTSDIKSGEIHWQGHGVINPFDANGELVQLEYYPLLRDYLEERKETIANRYCARKNPSRWYRTIDKIHIELLRTPKLLIPDIKGNSHIVYDEGRFYPHHNLYYITSKTWNLRALQAVLLSSVTFLFISSYSTRMRGGFLRFQAQYLRRLRVPQWSDVPQDLRVELISAGERRDIVSCNEAVFELYKITPQERRTLNKLITT